MRLKMLPLTQGYRSAYDTLYLYYFTTKNPLLIY